MFKRTIIYILCCTMMLLSGCTTGKLHSIKEINEYVEDNEEELIHIAGIASGILTEEYRQFIMVDGVLKVYSQEEREHAKTNADFYIDAENVPEISDDEIRIITDFLRNNYVNSISLVPYGSEHSIQFRQGYVTYDEENAYIEMGIEGDRWGHSGYEICFIDSDDVSNFRNPLDWYAEGKFKETIDQKNNSAHWVYDKRFNPFIREAAPIKYEAYLNKAAKGIWVSSWDFDIPAYCYFFAVEQKGTKHGRPV